MNRKSLRAQTKLDTAMCPEGNAAVQQERHSGKGRHAVRVISDPSTLGQHNQVVGDFATEQQRFSARPRCNLKPCRCLLLRCECDWASVHMAFFSTEWKPLSMSPTW